MAEKPEKLPSIITTENQMKVVEEWSNQLNTLTKAQSFELTPQEVEFGTSIITGLVDKCVKDKIESKDLNLNNFLEQVKHYSRLQLSLQEQEIYLDVRNNKNTGLKDVRIARQYQGLEKIMTRYCTKKILRYKKGVVCKGDVFKTTEDFDLGVTKIAQHIHNPNIDRDKIENIEKAYYIAYVEECGHIVPYTVIVDRHRINVAYNASPSNDKTVWKNHSQRMAIKTACICLYNDIMKPFIELPTRLKESYEKTSEDMNWTGDIETTNGSEPIIYDIDDVMVSNATPITTTDTNDNYVGNTEEPDFTSTTENEPLEDGILIIKYSEFKNDDKYKDTKKYVRENYPDGRDAYQVINQVKTIRLRQLFTDENTTENNTQEEIINKKESDK